MTRYDYDEEASAELRMDVVHEVDGLPASASRWVEAMRRLNAIDDPLARRLISLHRDCGSGTGECDRDDMGTPVGERRDWGCETTQLIANHFKVAFPG